MVSDRRLFFLMHRATRALVAHANAQAYEQLGVSSAQLTILFYVAKHPGCSMVSIADLLDLNKSATSGTLNRLERAGLVRREPNPRDGRSSLLSLTPKGERVHEQSLPFMRRLTSELTEPFTEKEIDTVLRFLHSVVERYGDGEPRSRS